MMTRRFFVSVLTTATAAVDMGLGTVFVRRRHVTTAQIEGQTVLPLRGARVTLRGSDGQYQLAKVDDVSSVRRSAHGDAPATEQISILVRQEGLASSGGLYRLEGADLCLGELHFLPVGGDGKDRRLEAVINRIV